MRTYNAVRSTLLIMTAIIAVGSTQRSDAQVSAPRQANAPRKSVILPSGPNVTVERILTPAAAAHRSFEQAAHIMDSALPIYDGHKHRAIELARMAAKEMKEVDRRLPSPFVSNDKAPAKKTAAERAASVPRGSNINLFRFTSYQVYSSNARMQLALQLVQQGMMQMQSAGTDSAGHLSDATVFANEAIQSINKGLQFAGVSK